jgi:hypothetical protein
LTETTTAPSQPPADLEHGLCCCQATVQQALEARGAPLADAAEGPAARVAPGRLRALLGDPLTSQALAFTVAGAAIGMSVAMLAMVRVNSSR